MSITAACLLIFLLPELAQKDSICTPAAESGDKNNLEDDSAFLDILFVQYRGVFRDLLGRRCVYSPSCSNYGQEAIGRRGPVFGVMMALERWTRCNSAAFNYGDYTITERHELVDPVEPGKDVTCWGRFLLPF
jgi:putative component of membrane protein insertase Oxa1/YidC/SpoIIIJ protein YidD